jgi:hypothetical protein
MIKEYLIKKSLDLILAIGSKVIKNTKFSLQSTKLDIEESLNIHLRSVKNWCSEVSFTDLKKSKSLEDIFIDLDLYVFPRRVRLSVGENISKIPLEKIFKKEPNHIALLGQPGSGKTTSMKHLCHSILFEENFYPDHFDFPILIQLRDFNRLGKQPEYKRGLIYNYLFDILGLKLIIHENQEEDQIQSIKEKIVTEILNNVKSLIILDGFDELQFYNRRELIIHELGKLARTIESSRIIITSRTADFNYSTEKLSIYEISPLNDEQIYKFAHKWLKDNDSADKFLEAIRNSPFYDATIRPLTIAHLCAIFERVGKIPEKPKTVYRKIVNLLLEEWDEQKSIRRQSEYSGFEIDRKFEFLSNLAYALTLASFNVSFSKIDLENAYFKIFQDFDLNKNDAEKVVSELESHTGLFVQAGYHEYEFAHKSLQEFLTAEFIVKLPTIPDQRNTLIRLPDELAIAVTISSSPSSYFIELINNRFVPHKFNYKFIKSFISRLIVEKPDFNSVEEVGISALVLYSLYLNSLSDDQSQLRIFYPDSLITQFESLIDSIFKRNTKDLIEKHYEQISILESDSGHKIVLLQLADKRNKRYPKTLYCRDSFIKDLKSN